MSLLQKWEKMTPFDGGKGWDGGGHHESFPPTSLLPLREGRKLFLYSIGVTLQFDTVKECNASMITAAGTIKTVIEDPLFPVPKEDPCKTQPARQVRSPGLDNDPAAPGSIVFMKHFVSHSEVSALFLSSVSRGWKL
jgi:hypothetical protein